MPHHCGHALVTIGHASATIGHASATIGHASATIGHASATIGVFCALAEVCDFKGAGLGLLYPPFYVFASPWVKMTQRNYPNIASSIRFVNPPGFLAALWRLLTPLFDEDTVKKMQVAGRDESHGVPDEAIHLRPTSELPYLQSSRG